MNGRAQRPGGILRSCLPRLPSGASAARAGAISIHSRLVCICSLAQGRRFPSSTTKARGENHHVHASSSTARGSPPGRWPPPYRTSHRRHLGLSASPDIADKADPRWHLTAGRSQEPDCQEPAPFPPSTSSRARRSGNAISISEPLENDWIPQTVQSATVLPPNIFNHLGPHH
mgnify:CR=1 FL=1